MRNIITLTFLIISLKLVAQNFDVDFGSLKSGTRWEVIDDDVMGGLSRGEMLIKGDAAIFSGTVSLLNKGGFSSFKGPFKKMDLSKYKKIIIKYRSKGHKIAFTLEMDRRWFLPYYKRELQDTGWKWKEQEILFSEFERYSIARKKPGKPTLKELQNMLRIGFITNEKKEGKFKIEVDYIKFE